jgi:HK97 gp10 family phage protein
MASAKFTSYLKSIEKDLVKAEYEVLKKASMHVRKKIAEKAKSMFRKQSGNLTKGIMWDRRGQHSTLVGVGSPAQHAHLLELGTVERKQKKSGRRVGKVTARPFILPTFEEELAAVKEILSEKWL